MERANIRVEVGAMFANKNQLKSACQTFATRANFEYKVLKSDKSRMIIKCIGEGCSWRLHASNVDGVKDGYFEIKTIKGEHRCFDVQYLGHRQVSAKFIAEQFQAKLHNQMKYRGILLAATATNANRSLFPLASAVVDAENDDNWFWFIQLLRRAIEQHAPQFLIPRALSVVSDRQKGLLEGVERVFPNSPHG